MRVITYKSIAFAIIAFLISVAIYPYYHSGDQYHYRLFYENSLNERNLYELYKLYGRDLDAAEPIYFFIVYFSALFFDKDIIFSVANALVIGISSFLLIKRGVNSFFIFLLLFGFYFFTIGFSAERLKISILFFLLGLFISGSNRWIFIIFSVLSHFQMVITVLSYLGFLFSSKIKDFSINYWRIVLILIFSMIIFLIIYIIYLKSSWVVHVENKLASYDSRGWGGFQSFFKTTLFMLIAMVFSLDKKIIIFSSMIPIVVSSFFLGSERLLFLSFFLMIYFVGKGGYFYQTILFILATYFFTKGIFALNEIIINGVISA